MKAITLTQPWATLMAYGLKTVETRSWDTNYRGDLAIHAAAGFPKVARDLCRMGPFRAALTRIFGQLPTSVHTEQLPLGQVLCVVRLHYTVSTDDGEHADVPAEEYLFGDYSSGRFAWFTDNLCQLERPFHARGKLQLWEISDEAIAAAGRKGRPVL